MPLPTISLIWSPEDSEAIEAYGRAVVRECIKQCEQMALAADPINNTSRGFRMGAKVSANSIRVNLLGEPAK